MNLRPVLAVPRRATPQRPLRQSHCHSTYTALSRRIPPSARGGIAGPVEIAALTTGPALSKAVP